jgi:hypothetical protein
MGTDARDGDPDGRLAVVELRSHLVTCPVRDRVRHELAQQEAGVVQELARLVVAEPLAERLPGAPGRVGISGELELEEVGA